VLVYSPPNLPQNGARSGAATELLTAAGEGMDFTPVDSRMILGIRYNEKTYELDVVFRSGEKYRYKNVPLLFTTDW
jgi:hypothetical protein